MTLDEAIRHCMEKSKELRGEMIDCAEIHDYENAEICRDCADEHDQLAKWLEELKQRREQAEVAWRDKELQAQDKANGSLHWIRLAGRGAGKKLHEAAIREIEIASKRHPIIAVDFDGTLCENEWPGIGAPKWETIQALIAAQAAGARLILWTNRIGARLREAVEWCQARELEFDAINENLPETLAAFTTDCRKVYADIYLDDKAAQPSTAVLEALWETARSVMNGEPEQPQACNPAHRGSVTAEQFEAIWNDNEGEGGDGDEL